MKVPRESCPPRPTSRGRFEDHDRSLPRPPIRVIVRVIAELAESCPQAFPLLPDRSSRMHGPPAALEFDLGVRLSLEVEPPGRLRRTPAVHRHRDEVRTVL